MITIQGPRQTSFSFSFSISVSVRPSSFGTAQRSALRSDTRRELAAGGLDTVCRTVSTAEIYSKHRRSAAYFAQFTHDAPCEKVNRYRRDAAAPFRSVRRRHLFITLPVTTSQARDTLTLAKPRVFSSFSHNYYDVSPTR